MLALPAQLRNSFARSLREKNCSSTGFRISKEMRLILRLSVPYAPIGCNSTVSFISPDKNADIAFGWVHQFLSTRTEAAHLPHPTVPESANPMWEFKISKNRENVDTRCVPAIEMNASMWSSTHVGPPPPWFSASTHLRLIWVEMSWCSLSYTRSVWRTNTIQRIRQFANYASCLINAPKPPVNPRPIVFSRSTHWNE